MYPWERVIPSQDSTLRIIHEAVKRGHEVSITHPSNLTIRDSITLSLCKQISLAEKLTSNITSFYKTVKFNTEMCPLKEFDVIFMRDNPPLDGLVLNFLDSIKDDVFIINAIDGLREANKRILTKSSGLLSGPTQILGPLITGARWENNAHSCVNQHLLISYSTSFYNGSRSLVVWCAVLLYPWDQQSTHLFIIICIVIRLIGLLLFLGLLRLLWLWFIFLGFHFLLLLLLVLLWVL